MRRGSRGRAAGLAACLAALALAAPPAVARDGLSPVTTRGRWLVDGQGRALLPHGLNVVAKRPPYTAQSLGFGADDAAFLAAHGFDVVRLGVMYGGVEPRPGAYSRAYLDEVARTVAVLHAHGLRTVLDFHQDQFNERFRGQGFPDWAVQDGGLPNPRLGFPVDYVANPALQHAFDRFYADARGPGGVGLRQRYAAAWRHVARRFARTPGVLGYDVMNEPSPGAGAAACLSAAGCAAFERGPLDRLGRTVARAIRRVDGRTPVLYEPPPSAGLGFPSALPRLRDPHAVLSWHLYVPAERQPALFAAADAHAGRREAQLLTEFGSTTDTAAIRRAADLADRHLVGWTEWTYSSNGSTDNPGTPSLVADPRRPPVGANVDRAQLAALARPHASAVAGLPTRMAYDPATRRLELRWRPTRAATGPTRILLPAAWAPRGHRVTVRGGRVVRDRRGVLDVRARGRGGVAVTVRPR